MKPWSGAASHILLGQMRGPEIILGYGIGRCFMGNQWCPWVLHVVSMYTPAPNYLPTTGIIPAQCLQKFYALW